VAFASPKYGWLLLLLPALAFFYVLAAKKRRELLRRFVGPTLAGRLVKGVSEPRRRLKFILFALSVIGLVLALMQPRWGYRWEEVTRRGIDIYLVLDISSSMLAQDVSPSRLERAKRKIGDFTAILEGDRVGLIAFAGRSFVQCPLTLDYSALQIFLQSLDPNSVSVPGTDLGGAINQAIETFDKQSKKSKVVVLFSDGENLQGDVEKAAEKAKSEGVRLYAMGIGTTQGAPIPREAGDFRKDRRGDVIITHLDETLLKKITLATGGSYVNSVAGDDDVRQIYDDIRRTGEERETKGGREKKFQERFQWPLLIAVFLLALEFLLGEGKTKRIPFKFPRISGRRALPVLFLLWSVTATRAPAELVTNERLQGQEAYRKGAYEDAVKHFLNAQIEDPNNARIKYDLANSYYKMGKFDEAGRLFESLGNTNNPDLKERSHYNLGNTHYRENKLEDAIKEYEQALKLNPKDSDSQYNLEQAKKALQQKKEQKPDDKNQNDKKSDKKDESKNSDNSKPNQGGEPDPSKKSNESEKKNPEKEKKEGKQDGKDADQKPGDQKENAAKENGKEKEKGKENEKGKGKEEGKEMKEGQSPGKSDKMSEDEAKMWLSRLNEEKKQRENDKKNSATSQTDVDKDW
jgi:Ca-activated chloride channel family protein